MRGLERVKCRRPAACEEADSAAGAAADPFLQQLPGCEKVSRPGGLEAQQVDKLWTGMVELRHVEAAPVLEWKVDAPELEIGRASCRERV